MSILDLMANTQDIAQTTPTLSALPVSDGERWAHALGTIAGHLASPHGILLVLALVVGVAAWLHSRRAPARELSQNELDHYQG